MKHLISTLSKKARVLATTASMFLLTGCQIQTDSALYTQIKNQTDLYANNTEQIKQDSVVYLAEKAYNFCNSLKSIAPFVIIGSICLGLLLLRIIQEDQAVRKKALFWFVITIPLIMFLLTYVLSWAVGTYL